MVQDDTPTPIAAAAALRRERHLAELARQQEAAAAPAPTAPVVPAAAAATPAAPPPPPAAAGASTLRTVDAATDALPLQFRTTSLERPLPVAAPPDVTGDDAAALFAAELRQLHERGGALRLPGGVVPVGFFDGPNWRLVGSGRDVNRALPLRPQLGAGTAVHALFRAPEQRPAEGDVDDAVQRLTRLIDDNATWQDRLARLTRRQQAQQRRDQQQQQQQQNPPQQNPAMSAGSRVVVSKEQWADVGRIEPLLAPPCPAEPPAAAVTVDRPPAAPAFDPVTQQRAMRLTDAPPAPGAALLHVSFADVPRGVLWLAVGLLAGPLATAAILPSLQLALLSRVALGIGIVANVLFALFSLLGYAAPGVVFFVAPAV